MEDRAFQSLLEAHYKDAFRFAKRLAGGNEDLAGDIVQNASISAWKNRATLADGEKFSSWYMTIVYRLHLNHYRREHRYPTVSLQNRPPTNGFSENECTYQDLIEDTRDGHREFLVNFEGAKIIDAIKRRMPKEFRDIYFTFIDDEPTYEELAKRMNVPVTTIKIRLFRARKWIERWMDHEIKSVVLS